MSVTKQNKQFNEPPAISGTLVGGALRDQRISVPSSGLPPDCIRTSFQPLQRTVWGFTLIICLIIFYGKPAFADDVTLIAGLRERRLFELAERYGIDRLSQPDLAPTAAATLTIEQIKTQTAKAILGNASQRVSNWSRAIQTAEAFLQENPQHPRALLIQVQLALTHLAHGKLLRQELAAEMIPAAELATAQSTALDELRTANSLFSEIQRDILKKIPEQRGRTLSSDELTSAELMALNNSVRYQSAIGNFNRAQLYTVDDRLNRIDAINQVLESLDEVQRQTSLGQPLWWDSQILQIECLRSVGKIDEAQAIANRLTAVEDVIMPQSLLEQQLRVAIDRDDQAAAITALRGAEAIENRQPTLDLARLETYSALSARSQGASKTDWLNRAAQLARIIEAEHGSYWGRRAKLILIGNNSLPLPPNDAQPGQPRMQPGTSSAELDLMMGLAEQAARKQRYDDAVKAYDRAAEMASDLNAMPQAFSLAVRASQALEKLGQHETAAIRLTELARAHTNYELAAAAHLRGCWNYRKTNIDDVKKHQQLVEWFEEHLQRWPQSASVPTVHVWLGEALHTHQQWSSAFQNYSAVPVTDSLFGDSLKRAIYCAHHWVESQPADQRATVAAEVTLRIQSLLTGVGDPGTDMEWLAHSEIVVALTEIGIRYGTIDPVEMVQPLISITERQANAEDDATIDKARVQLFALLTFDDSPSDTVLNLFAKIANNMTSLAAVEAIITAYGDRFPQRITDASRQWRLRTIDGVLAGSEELDETEKTAWLYRRSLALADLQQPANALQVLTELEKTHPDDPAILMEIARMLTRVHSEYDLEIPLNRWRQLATRLKPHTDRWYEAKYNIALLLEKTGQREAAEKFLEFLKTIPPGWEKSTYSAEFEILLQRLK